MDIAGLVEEIYEAAIVPDLWHRLLDRLAEIAGAEGTLLFAARPGATRHINSPRIDRLIEAWVKDGWAGARNDRGNRLIPIREPRFLTDFDGFSPEEMDRSPFYTEYLRPLGFWWCVGTAIHSPTADTIIFSIERLERNGPVEPEAVRRLDHLRPHLARAAVLSARVGIERMQAGVIALETVGLPAAIVDATGRVLAANGLFAGCSPSMRIGAHDRLLFGDETSDTAFRNALRHGGRGAAASLALPARDAAAAAVAHLVPLKGSARDVFTGAACLVYATVLAPKGALPAALIEVLFDLTAAEARVASMVAAGTSVAAAALKLSVTPETIRAHLKSVYAKTGVHRQIDLARLLSERP